ncbi:MAG: hypothetical protein EBQ99_07340 [Planctomycetes bacterium]|nr:hypothetical protein [Planctomycetota bacterium]
MPGTLRAVVILAAAMAQSARADLPGFGAPESIPLGEGAFPTQPVLADFDGDGQADLLVPGRNTDGTVALIRGVGAVAPVVEHLQVGGQTDWAEAADLDADGHLDVVLAVRNIRGGVAILRGRGDGSFDPVRFIWTGRECRCVAVGDVDGDAKPDVVACNARSGTLRVLRNLGQMQFEAGTEMGVNRWSVGSPGQSWVALRPATEGASLADISVGGGRLNLRAASAAGWLPETSWSVPSVQGTLPGISFGELADLDGDGLEEWISQSLTTTGLNPLLVWRGEPGGVPGAWQSWPGPTLGRGFRAVTADLDGDGDRDVLSLSVLEGQLVAMENVSSPGQIQLRAAVPLLEGSFLRHVVAGDVDGDGRRDLLVCDASESRVLRLRNLGPAGVPPARRLARMHLDEPSEVTDASREMQRLLDVGPSPAAAGPEARLGTRSMPSACGPEAGRCDEPHATPGCYTPSCCEKVCLLLPECCETAWDQACVDWADSECAGLVCPSPGNCLLPHGEAGCDDAVCCERVRRLDPVCDGVWDELCVELARLACGVEPPVLEVPADAIDEAEPCGQRLSEGCGNRSAPNFVPVVTGQRRSGRVQAFGVRDVDAHLLTLAAPALVRLELRPEFPAHLVLAGGPCEGPLQTLAEAFALPGGVARIDRMLPAGSHRVFVSMATPLQALRDGQPCPITDPEDTTQPGLFGGAWWMSIEDRSGKIGCDLDGSGSVDAADIGSLLVLFGGSGPAGDLDGSGEVDAADIGSLLICFD